MKPIRYKNATIEDHPYPEWGDKYQWVHDEYDAWWDDGMQRSNGGAYSANTIEECKEQIDEWIDITFTREV